MGPVRRRSTWHRDHSPRPRRRPRVASADRPRDRDTHPLHRPTTLTGTRATVDLDLAYFASGAALPADPDELAGDFTALALDPGHGGQHLPGTLTIRDRR
jgi:hypothetical protein